MHHFAGTRAFKKRWCNGPAQRPKIRLKAGGRYYAPISELSESGQAARRKANQRRLQEAYADPPAPRKKSITLPRVRCLED